MKLIPIKGNKHYYATIEGDIYSTKRKGCNKLKGWPNGWDYLNVTILGKARVIHRLIARTFIPNPEDKPQVNHKNGIKTDNRLENLEWVTQKENIHHAMSMGLMGSSVSKIGRDNYSVKLKVNEVIEIKHLLNEGARYVDLAKWYNVDPNTISNIKIGKSWKHVTIEL